MTHDQCANPTCVKNKDEIRGGPWGLDHRWVQVEEKDVVTAGQQPVVATIRTRLAGVCCSRRCAAEFLTANLDEEDARIAADQKTLRMLSGNRDD